jgi:hypothetical protein
MVMRGLKTNLQILHEAVLYMFKITQEHHETLKGYVQLSSEPEILHEDKLFSCMSINLQVPLASLHTKTHAGQQVHTITPTQNFC